AGARRSLGRAGPGRGLVRRRPPAGGGLPAARAARARRAARPRRDGDATDPARGGAGRLRRDAARRRDPLGGGAVTRLLDVFQAMIRGEVDPPPVSRLVGFRMTEAREGFVAMEMEVEERHTSPP